MTLGGIIYLLSIGEKRMKGTTRRSLDMFHHLCGDNALARVILGTTNWGEVEEDVGVRREQQWIKTFWEPMMSSGSKSLHFVKTKSSARAFLDAILGELFFKQRGASRKNKTDSILVGGRPTDIVIPCDPFIKFLSYYHYLSISVSLAHPELEKAL